MTNTRVQNERTFRAANQAIEHNRVSPPNELIEFRCECSDRGCGESMKLTKDEYDVVRRTPARFVLLTGHEDELERVIDEFDRYTIVEK